MGRPTNYVKVDNAIGTNPKFMQIDDEHYLEAVGLYVLMLGFCDRGNTDGIMRRNAVSNARGIAPGRDDLLEVMAEIGLISIKRDTITIADYTEWQRTKSEKHRASVQGRMGADARWNADSNANGNADSNADGNAQESIGENKREELLPNSRFAEVYKLASATLGIGVFSEADRAKMRQWAEFGHNDDVLLAALGKAKGKDRPILYAHGCLRNGIEADKPQPPRPKERVMAPNGEMVWVSEVDGAVVVES